jgi:hypothetical protein
MFHSTDCDPLTAIHRRALNPTLESIYGPLNAEVNMLLVYSQRLWR